MKIYTRTGDHGMTSLVGGLRVSKTSQRLEAYGTLDELNSHLGFLASLLPKDDSISPLTTEELTDFLYQIQSRLFDLGAYLATEPKQSDEEQPPRGITETEIAAMEAEIDRLTTCLPQLNSFILPAGTPGACQAHICRTVCRRAERNALAISPIPHPLAIAYLNRLSDYLFTLARYINHISGAPEIPWRP